MALITCSECGREISDKAPACVGCGASIQTVESKGPDAVEVSTLTLDVASDNFVGSKKALVDLAMKAVMEVGYKLDGADVNYGIVSFTTGMTWGSWSGVSGSLYLQEVAPGRFVVSGTAKQNAKGWQLAAFNICNEAQRKVRKIIDIMKEAL